MQQLQIGKEYFGRVIFWRNVPPTEFFPLARLSLAPPGIELSDAELVSVFQDGLIQRDSRTGTYYRFRQT